MEASLDQVEQEIGTVESAMFDQIRSAGTPDAIRNLTINLDGIRDDLAVAIFNVHLLGRAQVFVDTQNKIQSVIPVKTGIQILSALILDKDFEPLPFDEAINFFRGKTNLSRDSFDNLAQAARDKAFTIAASAQGVVQDGIRDLLDTALSDGLTLREFQGQAEDILDRLGVSEQTPWYWETVYRTNLQTSYQVGRFKQMTDPDVLAERPFFRYVSARLPTSRVNHVANHGLVFPADHEFWNTWYPPNGFNCLCSVMSVSPSLLQRRKWRVSSTSPSKTPDKGFISNPGRGADI